MSKQTKAFSADVSLGDSERAVIAKISTIAVDRDSEVLVPQGMNSKDFEKNPVVFVNHNYWTLPVGKVSALKRDTDTVTAKVEFAARPDNFPANQEWLPDTLLSLFKQQVVKGFSVGFMPIESRPATDRDVEKYGSNCRRVTSKWYLLELSVAPLPANQEALATAVSKGMLSAATAKGLFGIEAKSEDSETDDGEMKCGPCPKCGTQMKAVDGACKCDCMEDEDEDDEDDDKAKATEPEPEPDDEPQPMPKRLHIVLDLSDAPDIDQAAAKAATAVIAKMKGRIYL